MTNTFRKYWSLMNNSLSLNYLSQHSSQKKKSEHIAATQEGSIVRKIEVVGGDERNAFYSSWKVTSHSRVWCLTTWCVSSWPYCLRKTSVNVAINTINVYNMEQTILNITRFFYELGFFMILWLWFMTVYCFIDCYRLFQSICHAYDIIWYYWFFIHVIRNLVVCFFF